MSVKRKLGCFAVGDFSVILIGIIGLTIITQSARDAAIAHIEKPEVVKRFERQVVVKVPAQSERAPADESPDTKRIAAYTQLAERTQTLYDSLEYETRKIFRLYTGERLTDEQVKQLLEIIEVNPGLIEQIRQTVSMGGPVSQRDFSRSTMGIGKRLRQKEDCIFRTYLQINEDQRRQN